MKPLALAVLAAALLAAVPAHAQTRSSRWGSLEVGGGPYIPNVDKNLGGKRPYHDVFGGAPGILWRIHVAKSLYAGYAGGLELGFRTGYFRKSGHALFASGENAGKPSGDKASFNVIPTSLTLTYRADQVYEAWRVPLVPYARVALERYNWWTTKENKWTKRGATNGFSGTAGVALVIDWLDPDATRDIDNEVGVNHTALYFDVTKSKVDDFGSKKSWDLSEKRLFWSAGLLLVF